MIQIRAAQMASFREYALERFIHRMRDLFQIHYPAKTSILGEAGVCTAIRFGIERARSYDVTSERHVCHYLNTMFLLGGNFDRDVQIPWARETLNLSDEAPGERMARLNRRVTSYLNRISGLHGEVSQRVVTRIAAEPVADLWPARTEDFAADARRMMRELYPEKVDAWREDEHQQVLFELGAAAQAYGLERDSERMTYLVLMLILGSRFDQDPLFPAAQEALHAPVSGRPSDVAALYGQLQREMWEILKHSGRA